MAGRATRIAARIVFFVSGAVSIAVGVVFWSMHGTELPYQADWPIFAGVPFLTGVVAVLSALLPRRWTGKVFGVAPDDPSLLTVPGEGWLIVAATAYLIALVFHLTRESWHPGQQWTFSLCIVCGITASMGPQDHSLVSILLMLAPINAAIYGSIGLTLGYAWFFLRRRP